jgi:hypothetical protein
MARAKGDGSRTRSGEMRWKRLGLMRTSFGARFSVYRSDVGSQNLLRWDATTRRSEQEVHLPGPQQCPPALLKRCLSTSACVSAASPRSAPGAASGLIAASHPVVNAGARAPRRAAGAARCSVDTCRVRSSRASPSRACAALACAATSNLTPN